MRSFPGESMKLSTLTERRQYLMKQAREMAQKYKKHRDQFYKTHSSKEIEHFEEFYREQNKRYRKGITEPQIKRMMVWNSNAKKENDAYDAQIKTGRKVRK